MVQFSLIVLLLADWLLEPAAIPLLKKPNKKCKCQNWKKLYGKGLTCGSGKEFVETALTTPKIYKMENNATRTKMCENFFEHLDTDRCVNLNVGKDEGTWCYVSAACKDIGAGAKVPKTDYSWKVCTDYDAKLRDYTPEELYDFSRKNDLLFGGVHRMAYPGVRAGEGALTDVDSWGRNNQTFSVGIARQKFANGDKPVWFDTNTEGKLPTVIVKGTKVYKVLDNTTHDKEHHGTWTILKCIMGCTKFAFT